jgi:serine/threonine protein kinase
MKSLSRDIDQPLPADLQRHFRIEEKMLSNVAFERYEAYDLKCLRPVNLTVIRGVERNRVQKINQALCTLQKVTHPNVLPIFEYGQTEDASTYFWATPQAEPISIQYKRILEWNETEFLDFLTNLSIDILAALKSVHRFGFHHGLITPDIIFSWDGKFCLGDFALYIALNFRKRAEYARSFSKRYTAPEIENGRAIDVRADLYSVAVVLAEFYDKFHESEKELEGNSNRVSFFENKEVIEFRRFLDKLKATDPEQRPPSLDNAIHALEGLANSVRTLLSKPAVKVSILINGQSGTLLAKAAALNQSMPLLAKTIESIDPAPFNNTVILHINHCSEDIFIFNDLLCSLANDLIFVAIPYGDRPIPLPLQYTVYHAAQVSGVFELFQNGQTVGQSCYNFDSAINSLISMAFQETINRIRDGKKILIIEDGGYHYDVLHDLESTSKLSMKDSIIGTVEQTTSGVVRAARFSRTNVLSYPILTVARSNVKMRFEAYFIGRRVIDELNYLLYQFNDFLPFHNVVVIGYGIIGRNIASYLSTMNCAVSIIDTDSDIAALARNEGYEVFDKPPPKFFDRTPIIIGATGESSFTYSMLTGFLEGNTSKMYLVSASSKRIEFADLIEFFEGSFQKRGKIIKEHPTLGQVNDIQIEYNLIGQAYHFLYGNTKKSIVLVAGGFPVNFFRKEGISLTYRIIDPVEAEIMLLSYHLARFSRSLEKKIYLLGESTIPNLEINEQELMKNWIVSNGLSTVHESDVWINFKVHPFEAKLRIRCIL